MSYDRQNRIDEAINLALEYGWIEGAHHKQWVIDQMLRVLAGDQYDELIAASCVEWIDPRTYSIHEWDCGVTP